MMWNPQTNQRIQQVDLTSTIASRSEGLHGLGNLRSSDGKTYGEWELPESAPLVFSALAAQTGAEGEKKQSEIAIKYRDKRATAEYVSFQPTSPDAAVGLIKHAISFVLRHLVRGQELRRIHKTSRYPGLYDKATLY